jgi:hypothetical protein
MVELFAAQPVCADGEHSVLFELGNCPLHLPQREPGRLGDVLLAGGAPAGVLLVFLPHQGADAVHD